MLVILNTCDAQENSPFTACTVYCRQTRDSATVSEDREDTSMEDEGRESDEGGSEGDEGRAGCKYSDDGMGDPEDKTTDAGSNDEDDGEWTTDSEPESATARVTWDAALRASEVSGPQD